MKEGQPAGFNDPLFQTKHGRIFVDTEGVASKKGDLSRNDKRSLLTTKEWVSDLYEQTEKERMELWHQFRVEHKYTEEVMGDLEAIFNLQRQSYTTQHLLDGDREDRDLQAKLVEVEGQMAKARAHFIDEHSYTERELEAMLEQMQGAYSENVKRHGKAWAEEIKEDTT